MSQDGKTIAGTYSFGSGEVFSFEVAIERQLAALPVSPVAPTSSVSTGTALSPVAAPSPSAFNQFWAYQNEQITFWNECFKTPKRYMGQKVNWAVKVSRSGYAEGPGWQSAFIEGYLDDPRLEALRRCKVSIVSTTYDPEAFAVTDAFLKRGVAKGQWIAIFGDLNGTESGEHDVSVRPRTLKNHGYRNDL